MKIRLLSLGRGILFWALVFWVGACGSAGGQSSLFEAWDGRNQPKLILDSYNSEKFQTKFSELPLEGRLEVEPWSDSYWPSFKGGIASRWRDFDVSDQFAFKSASYQDAPKLTKLELAKLSPAEKFDLFAGYRDQKVFRHERQRVSPTNATWEGLCHGWAIAALVFNEPKPVIAKSSEGLELPFASSDIKALLSLAQGNYSTEPTQFLGGRCNRNLKDTPQNSEDPECKDVNAGSFHLTLANMIGIKKAGFVMDITRDLEVWNQPVFAYKSAVKSIEKPSEGAATGTRSEVVIESVVRYGVESVPAWETLVGTEFNNFTEVTYSYRLELDGSGQIIGGEWLQAERPDFLWTQKATAFTGYFKPLKNLLEQSYKSIDAQDPVVEDFVKAAEAVDGTPP